MRALIFGVTGQDGSYLARLLLSKGYEVHGVRRRLSAFNTYRIDDLLDQVTLHYGDLTDSASLFKILAEVKPDEIYNLAAQSHVHVSFENPVYTADVNATGVLRLLEAVRLICPEALFYQACSSEVYGSTPPPQNEESPHHPKSPYGVSKLAAYWYGVNYREAYGLKVRNGILFNHESPVRGETFVTRKVVRGLVAIYLGSAGREPRLLLGNLEAQRDWGHARDYVDAIWRIQQHGGRDHDFVIGTGDSHSVREFISEVGNLLGIDPFRYIEFSKDYVRPAEVDALRADASRARKVLGWHPKVDFKALVREMVEAETHVTRRIPDLKVA